MTTQPPLFLHEELLLLALRDEDGTISAATYPYALAGAILAELLLHQRIEVEPSTKKLVHLTSNSAVGDAVIDECLEKIAAADRLESLTDWVERFTAIKRLKERVAEGLCRRGILREEKGTFLFIFPRTTYPEVNHGPEGDVMKRLHEAIFTETEEVDTRTAVLLSLASGTDMLPTIFDSKELNTRQERIDWVTHDEEIGQAAKEAIEAMHAALAMMSINSTLIS
jgi:hypothetical protein